MAQQVFSEYKGRCCYFASLFVLNWSSVPGRGPGLFRKCAHRLTKFSILSFGIPDSETGTSCKALLNRLRISMFSRFAIAGGSSVILLWLRVNLVMFFIPHSFDMSGSKEMRALSEKSSSAFCTPAASSRVFLMILEAMTTLLRET